MTGQTSTSVAGPVATSTHRALRSGLLLAVLAGLFGMHGLTGQGLAGMSMQTAPSALGATSSMSMDASDLATIPTRIMSDAGRSAGDQTEDLLEVATRFGHGGMAMGVMCLAFLGAALLALLRLLHRVRVAPVVGSFPRSIRAIIPHGRDRDPPCLIKLSIHRC